jgi:hypothetical protein
MNNIDYNKLIDQNKDEVFIFHCPAHAPFVFAVHSWLVCNEKGKLSRWEMLFRENKDNAWGYLHLNRYAPFEGIEMFSFLDKWQWESELLDKIDGEIAERMIDIIKASQKNYPHSQNYSLIGTNSNTYVQWVLDQAGEKRIKLPWNAFGKNAK